MTGHVEQILDRRQHRVAPGQGRRSMVLSVLVHAGAVAAFVIVPSLFHEPPEPFETVAITVVPPKALGVPDPPPPTPRVEPQPTPPPEKREPPPPEKKEPPPPDRPVLAEKPPPPEKKEPPPPDPPPRKPPPPANPIAAPPRQAPPPPANPMARRRGSALGNPIGSSTTEATVGVEDPNFTYGYYLDRVVSVISENWTRPPIGVIDARLHFRILPDGTVVELKILRSSGDESFDQAALRAVRASSPLPPLPKSYEKDFLGINLTVK